MRPRYVTQLSVDYSAQHSRSTVTIEEPAADDAPRPRGPGRPRDAGRDRAILIATLKILFDKGYAGLSIESVAAKAALVVAALLDSARVAIPEIDTGALRSDLIELQRHQVELMNSPASRRVTAGLVADLAADPELSQIYVSQYLVPRRAAVAQVLQRGIDRGELATDADLDFIYDLLLGPLFMRAVVWGQPLTPEAAERSVEVVL